MAKKILIGLVAVIVVALSGWFVWGAMLPEKFEVSTTKVIDVDRGRALEALSDLKQWPKWSVWNEHNSQLPNLKITWGEQSVGKGASYTWTSDAGNGKLSILETREDGVDISVEFEGFPEARGTILLEEESGKTKATWGFTSNIALVWRPAMELWRSGMIEQFEKNLDGIAAFAKDGTINGK